MRSIILLFFMSFFFSCQNEVKDITFWKVDDVTTKEERIAVLMDGQPEIINIYVRGTADGPFQIFSRGDGATNVFDSNGGEIDTVVSQYWKSPVCKTTYLPKGIQEGDINISVLLYPKK